MSYLKRNLLLISLSIFLISIIIPKIARSNDTDIAPLHIVSFNKDAGTIGINETSNLNVLLGFSDNRIASNYDGKLIITDNKLFSINNSNSQLRESLPTPNQLGIVKPVFSARDNLLLYWDASDRFNKTIHFYDYVLSEIIESHTFNYPEGIDEFRISRDGSTITMTIDGYLTIFDYENGKYTKSKEIGRKPAFSPIISKNGSRIYYDIRDDQDVRLRHYYYVEHRDNRWSEPKELTIPKITINDQEVQQLISGIANDGKTVVTHSDVAEKTETQILSVMHENEGVWSEPELVGEFQHIRVESPRGFAIENAEIFNSEDGRVIAIQQPKTLLPLSDQLWSYDIFVFIKDQWGEWSKHQVNPPDIGMIASADVLLSPNGEKLFWVPESIDSGVPFDQQFD